jgi:hypothetical protein
MFNTKGPSSYGKGIASNLVTEEQRQKYNSGGRVGYYSDFPGGEVTDWRSAPLTYSHLGQPVDPFHQRPELWYQPYKSIGSKIKKLFDETGEGKYEKIYGAGSIHGMSPEKLYESQTVPPYKFRTSDDAIVERDFIEAPIDKEKIKEAGAVEMTPSEFKTAQEDIQDMEPPFSKMQLKQAEKRVDEKFADPDKLLTGNGDDLPSPSRLDSESLDMQAVIDKYYDKEKSLGEAQLGFAGQVLKAGFQPKSKAMATIGDAMGAFGKTALAEDKAMRKLAATGEIQRELYTTSRAEEGKEDRRTAKFKNTLPEKEEKEWTTSDRFDIAQAAALKSGKKGDEALAVSVEYAMPGTSVKKLSGKTDTASLTKDAKAIEDGDENTLYIKDGLIWAKDSSGKLTVQVDFEDIGLIKATK